MTIEEKRKALIDYCNNREGCKDCPCQEDPYGNCASTVDEKLVIENYRRISSDVVNHPNHYTQGGIECIEAMKAAFGAHELAVYCKIAAFKYIWRCEHKNGLEDVKKAVWYLNKYIELEGGAE